MKNFEILLGENQLLKSVRDRGFEEPSEIQKKSIPHILNGSDVIASAATGSGKTLAFAAGLINNVKRGHGIQGLVLTPTRELAEQVTSELADFSKYNNIRVLSIYGGVSIDRQIKNIMFSEIVVCTPGRMLDHLYRNSIDLSKINTLVLDEVDKMFDMGFREDVERIIASCPKKRQTLLFSATISPEIFHMGKKYMTNPIEISAEHHVDAKKLKQVYYDVDNHLKLSLLKNLLENEDSKLIMIFCNTRRNVDFVSANLKIMGFNVVPIHGGFSQSQRNRFLSQFHTKQVHILVATDVAARGLDIEGITHIYNYDIPSTLDGYIHRIGRTARAGKEGKVINLLTNRDYESFQDISDVKEFNLIREETPVLERVFIKNPNRMNINKKNSRSNYRFTMKNKSKRNKKSFWAKSRRGNRFR